MIKFIETIHCTSRVHCKDCRTDKTWRESMMEVFEWDGECPISLKASEIQYQKEVLGRMIKRGCKTCEKRRQEKYIKSLEN